MFSVKKQAIQNLVPSGTHMFSIQNSIGRLGGQVIITDPETTITPHMIVLGSEILLGCHKEILARFGVFLFGREPFVTLHGILGELGARQFRVELHQGGIHFLRVQLHVADWLF